ncbi:MAG: elongation factor P [Candidatus Marinimicrobia bacterium]|nr:elongation factor P [Candidatus Neomarinimicrobiota bacterium]RKY61104.1 MAG: elongation factor P [Candidatus Neomarinimicrobiota bacterium]HHI02053.1 elongation factor P [candidate division Zixibacteria bacterium]
MATTADIKNGLIINLNNNLLRVIEFQHVKMARGGARIRTKLKNIQTGQIIDNTFRSGEKLDVVRLEANEMQYLYHDGNNYIFMNTETYEQVPLEEEIFKEASQYIKENEIVKILFHGNKAVDIEIPPHVNLQITETEPGMKGDTVTGATKNAVLETGLNVQVPLFLNVGDTVRIDTRTGAYVERIKE